MPWLIIWTVVYAALFQYLWNIPGNPELVEEFFVNRFSFESLNKARLLIMAMFIVIWALPWVATELIRAKFY